MDKKMVPFFWIKNGSPKNHYWLVMSNAPINQRIVIKKAKILEILFFDLFKYKSLN